MVYHANYLRYFERAREHIFGVDALVALYQDEQLGFVVYTAKMSFRRGAKHGDRLQVRTRVRPVSDYRLLFFQSIWRQDLPSPLVEGEIELVCLNHSLHRPVSIPEAVQSACALYPEEE